jgi:hypothetical protein
VKDEKMDIDAVRKKRQEEIEAKKKRLEELKKAKEAAASAPKADVAPKPTFSLPTPTSPLPSARPSAQVLDERDAAHESKSERETNDLVSSILSSSSRSGAKSEGFDVQYNRADKIKSFSLSRLSTTILPVERVSYNKECQTEEDDQTFLRDNEAEEEESRVYGEAKRVESSSHILMTPGRKAAPVGDGTLSAAASSSFSMHATQSHAQQPPQHHARKLSDEETQHILTDDKFLQFFEHATLHVERALEFNTSFDILRDYAADTSKQTSGEKAVTHTSTYYDCDFLKQRPIMDLKCSQLRPELFLAAYGSKPSLAPKSTTTAIANAGQGATNEDDAPGLVCIWARDLHTRPEIKLVASSPVLTAEFHHSEPQLIFGGCYNGQILLWDMSKSRSLPVQRSSWIAGKGHKHPVYAMAQTLSHELVTVSIDGMMCLWDVSRLTEPITTAMLEIPVPKPLGSGDMPTTSSSTSLFSPPPADFRVNQPPLNVSCMAYAQSDNASYIVVGSGAGELFKTQLPYKHTDASNLKVRSPSLHHHHRPPVRLLTALSVACAAGRALRVDHRRAHAPDGQQHEVQASAVDVVARLDGEALVDAPAAAAAVRVLQSHVRLRLRRAVVTDAPRRLLHRLLHGSSRAVEPRQVADGARRYSRRQSPHGGGSRR